MSDAAELKKKLKKKHVCLRRERGELLLWKVSDSQIIVPAGSCSHSEVHANGAD